MPKNKNKINDEKLNYLHIALGVFICIISILIIGRVEAFNRLYILFKIIFGEFSTIILLFLIAFSIKNLIFKVKIDLEHIYFIGFILIYIGISLLCHLVIYENLAMNGNNLFNKTINLYLRYLNYYEYSYSVGGGIIVGCIAQFFSFLGGKIFIILAGLGFIGVGVSYIIDIKIFKYLKTKSLYRILINSFNNIIKYFKGIHLPNNKEIPLSIIDENVDNNFTLQHEINKEKLEKLKRYLIDERIYAKATNIYTSYTSSRFELKLAHKSENIIKEVSRFFDNNLFIIKDNLTINVEIANQFRKILHLKELILPSINNKLPIFIDVNNKIIEYDLIDLKSLCVFGDYTSGVKTFIKCLIAILIYQSFNLECINVYDFNNEFSILDGTKIKYITNLKSMNKNLDEAFLEYEKRLATLKFLDENNINDANKKIRSMGDEYAKISPIFHIFNVNNSALDDECIRKISNLIQYANNTGIICILIIRDKYILNKINITSCNILSFYINDISTSLKLFGSDMALRLQKKGDVLYSTKNKIYHGQSPYLSKESFEKIIQKL